jgi:hypothetical protein
MNWRVGAFLDFQFYKHNKITTIPLNSYYLYLGSRFFIIIIFNMFFYFFIKSNLENLVFLACIKYYLMLKSGLRIKITWTHVSAPVLLGRQVQLLPATKLRLP